MPEWNDQAMILSVRPHAEHDAIVNVITAEHGRHAGLVRGGQSSKHRGTLQPGNMVEVMWRARLAEHLGAMQVELLKPHASVVLDDSFRLAGLASVCAIMEACLPEREPAGGVYRATEAVISMITAEDVGDEWLGAYIRWELGMLEIAGYALGLDHCGVTGDREGLEFVSPRTGVAVTRAGAGIHADRLLHLPGFLGGIGEKTLEEDLLDGMQLTGHFLERRVFGAHHQPMPPARLRLLALAQKRFIPNHQEIAEHQNPDQGTN